MWMKWVQPNCVISDDTIFSQGIPRQNGSSGRGSVDQTPARTRPLIVSPVRRQSPPRIPPVFLSKYPVEYDGRHASKAWSDSNQRPWQHPHGPVRSSDEHRSEVIDSMLEKIFVADFNCFSLFVFTTIRLILQFRIYLEPPAPHPTRPPAADQ